MEHYHFSATQSHTGSYLTDSLDCMHSVELVLASQLTLATYMLLFLRYLVGSTALLESPLKALGVFKKNRLNCRKNVPFYTRLPDVKLVNHSVSLIGERKSVI